MMRYTTVYKKENHVKLSYNSETGVIYVIWKNMFDQNLVRHVCEQVLQLVQKGAKVIIINLSKAKGAILEETHKWFQTYLFPAYVSAGTLRVLININSDIPVTRLAAQKWTKGASDFGFDVVTVNTKEEAAKVASEYLSE